MSDGLDKIRERMADYLNAQGVAAVTAWPAEERLRRAVAVAAVTLRACQAGPAGFQSYLGERYNQETEQWEEPADLRPGPERPAPGWGGGPPDGAGYSDPGLRWSGAGGACHPGVFQRRDRL